MLQAIRGKAGSWIVKILFVFLILSFGVWGVGDMFRSGGPDQTVAEIGDIEISVADVDRATRQSVEQMRQLFGPDFGMEQAAAMGLVDRALDTLVTSALLDQAAADFGIVPPDSLIADEIRATPAFHDPSGRFSRDIFLGLLARNGLNEQGFVAQLRRDISRQQIVQAVATGAGAPATLAENLYRYRHETRTADTITLTTDLAGDVPAPTDEQLRSFHEANGAMFSSPEYRDLTLVTLSAEDMSAEVSIGEETLKNEYEARIDSYHSPEMRRFDQVVAPDKAAADALVSAVRAGTPLAEAAEQASLSVIPLDWTTRDAMLPQIAEAGFALPENGVSDPVETPFGWHVLVATGHRPEGTRSFEEVRDELEAEIKLERAHDRMFEVANSLEDALAGGTALDQAADQLGLSTTRIPAIARDGSARDGMAPEFPDRDAVLGTAFSLGEGETSSLQDTPAGLYYVVRVDSVIEPAVRPLEEVRDQVAEAWTRQQRVDAVASLAESIAERLRNGDDAKAIAAEIGATFARTPALLRDGSNAGSTPRPMVRELFEMKVGDTAVIQDGDKRVVARLTDITEADPASAAEAVAEVRETAARQMAQDLVGQFTQALRGQYDVEINRSALDQIYRPG